jgi:O-antigen ligase
MPQTHFTKTFFLLAVVFSIVTLPFSIRINSLSIILLSLAWILHGSFKDKISRLNKPLFFLFISLYLIHVMGLLWTSNLRQGFWELEKKLSLFVLPIIFATTQRLSTEDKNKILKYFVFSCVAASLVCLCFAFYRTVNTGAFFEFDPLSNYTTYYFFYDGLSNVLLQSMYFSLYVVFAIFIVLRKIVKDWNLLSRPKLTLHLALAGYLFMFMFLLSTRIMTFAFLFIIVCYLIFEVVIVRRKIIAGVFFSLLIVATTFGVIYFIPTVKQRFQELVDSSYSFKNDPDNNKNLAGKLDGVKMRMAKWYFALEAGKDSWLFGKGTGDDEDALLATYLKNNFMEGYIPKYNAHNQYLQTWLGLGVFGLFILLSNLIFPLYLALKQKQFLYLVFLILILFLCATESMLCRQYGVVFYSYFNSFFAFHFLGTNNH